MFDQGIDKSSLHLALRCVADIRQCVKRVRSKLEDNPEAASQLLRPTLNLVKELLETQAEVDALLQEVSHAEAKHADAEQKVAT